MFTHLGMFFPSGSDPAFNMWYFGVYYAHLNESVLWCSHFIKNGDWYSFFSYFSPSEPTDTTNIFSYSSEKASSSLTQTCTWSKGLHQAKVPPCLFCYSLLSTNREGLCLGGKYSLLFESFFKAPPHSSDLHILICPTILKKKLAALV